MTSPRLSVVVPAHAASEELARCLDALVASDLPKDLWELIVVDDGSSGHAVTRSARLADQIVSLHAPASGPARARNQGASAARGDIVAFVDADVVVHRDALTRLLAAFDDASVSAAFGSYDDRPDDSGIVSQYRNLLHHRVHQRSAGEVDSFWAGLGAIRRQVFEMVSGFDAAAYRRPEMEDVELGYRLRDEGHTIVLDPKVLGTHLKKWTLFGMIASDFTRRGLPWARLLVSRNMLLSPRGLSLGASERVSAVLASLAVLTFIVALGARSGSAAVVAVVLLALFTVANGGLFRWLAEQRGLLFALASIPLHLAYSVNATASLVVGALSALLSRQTAPARYRHRQ